MYYARDLYLNGEPVAALEIPDAVPLINDFAFYNCSITGVEIPSGVTYIGWASFYGCSGITEITVPETVFYIDEWAFADCLSLQKITVDSANEFYSSDSSGVLFDKNKTKLMQYPAGSRQTVYSVPDSVTVIGDGALSSASDLESVTVPGSVETIGSYAFSSCSALTDVVLSDGIELIDEMAFFDCAGLKSVTIPGSVLSVGDYAFGYFYNGRLREFKIYCYADTAGEQYAKENGLAYELIQSVTDVKKGDVNGDNEVDSLDAVCVLKYDAGLTDIDSKRLNAADLNGDGSVDSLDAVIIFRYDAGLTDEL